LRRNPLGRFASFSPIAVRSAAGRASLMHANALYETHGSSCRSLGACERLVPPAGRGESASATSTHPPLPIATLHPIHPHTDRYQHQGSSRHITSPATAPTLQDEHHAAAAPHRVPCQGRWRCAEALSACALQNFRAQGPGLGSQRALLARAHQPQGEAAPRGQVSGSSVGFCVEWEGGSVGAPARSMPLHPAVHGGDQCCRTVPFGCTPSPTCRYTHPINLA